MTINIKTSHTARIDTTFHPTDDSMMMLAKLAAKTDTDGCIDPRIINYVKTRKWEE